ILHVRATQVERGNVMNNQLDRLLAGSIWTQGSERICALLDHAQAGGFADADFNEARLALECLPLSTDEFATAINRLANARSYLQAGERGAARFELLQLLRSLETGAC